MNKRNTAYTIEVSDPLIRPGMKVIIGPVSENYLVEATRKIMNMIREINEDKI